MARNPAIFICILRAVRTVQMSFLDQDIISNDQGNHHLKLNENCEQVGVLHDENYFIKMKFFNFYILSRWHAKHATEANKFKIFCLNKHENYLSNNGT